MNRILPGGDAIMDKAQVRRRLGISEYTLKQYEASGVLVPDCKLKNRDKPHYTKKYIDSKVIEFEMAKKQLSQN